MVWGPFSAEAVNLDCEIRRLHAHGRTTDAIRAIEEALARAHREGPSNVPYEQFEREADAQAVASE
jgi:hypothetical protein